MVYMVLFSGADLSALVCEASELAHNESYSKNEVVQSKHFDLAFAKIKPCVSLEDSEKYEKMESKCVNLSS